MNNNFSISNPKNSKNLHGVRAYFPENKHTWMKFLATSVPAILAAMVFSLNAFVDNFMSTRIAGGNQALAYANSWTEIVIGIVGLTSIIGSVVFAQYLGKQDFKKLKEVISMRLIFTFSICMIFCLPSWITPTGMIDLISGFDNSMNDQVKSSSELYLRIITVSWILNGLWYTLAMVLREKHHANVSLIASIISLVANIVLNSIFVYALHEPLEFLAYSTIISNFLGITYVIVFIYWKDHEIAINLLNFFNISKEVCKHFFTRFGSFALLAIGSVAVNLRFLLWNVSYPTGSIGLPEYQLAAANILGISGMFFNIFWTTFESIGSNVAIYVGKELGHNNFNEAVSNAKQLQGFHTILAAFMGMLLFFLSLGVEHMYFLADGYVIGLKEANPLVSEAIVNDAIARFLSDLKYTLWPLAFFMPMFIWFITRNRVISSGGHTRIVATVEAIAGTVQLGWLALVGLVFNNPAHPLEFPLAYFIFFLSDVPKLFIYEILIKKVDWVRNIVHEDEINIVEVNVKENNL